MTVELKLIPVKECPSEIKKPEGFNLENAELDDLNELDFCIYHGMTFIDSMCLRVSDLPIDLEKSSVPIRLALEGGDASVYLNNLICEAGGYFTIEWEDQEKYSLKIKLVIGDMKFELDSVSPDDFD